MDAIFSFRHPWASPIGCKLHFPVPRYFEGPFSLWKVVILEFFGDQKRLKAGNLGFQHSRPNLRTIMHIFLPTFKKEGCIDIAVRKKWSLAEATGRKYKKEALKLM